MSTSLPNRENEIAGAEDSYMDDLEDYDFPDIDISLEQIREPTKPVESRETGKKDSLGIDDEVKVRKKRVNVKLDETRLLGPSGIPKLRKDAPKLRFKGKGHEYRDAARLLSYYQLWADDLFKKARFRDTLTIIEKLGHTRTIRNERESWIQQSKKEKDRAAGIVHEGSEERNEQSENTSAINNIDSGAGNGVQREEEPLRSPSALTSAEDGALFLGDDVSDDDFGGAPDDAELDALMTSANIEDVQAATTKDSGPKPNDDIPSPQEDEFEDEMEAMAEYGF